MSIQLPNPYFSYDHKNLSVMGVKGMLETSLDEAGIIINIQREIEIAPVKKESGRDFLALIRTDSPVMDLTMAQYGLGETSIVGYSLNKKKLYETMRDMVDATGINLDNEADSEFTNTIGSEFPIEIKAYNRCVRISNSLKISLERSFGVARYCNFLSAYKNVSENQAFETAFTKFDINISQWFKAI